MPGPTVSPENEKSSYEKLRRRVRKWTHSSWFEGSIVILILISVTLTVWTEAATLNSKTLAVVRRAERWITLLFVIELSLRYWVERKKSAFFRQYWIDILAILPELRVFRMFRVLRLLRLLRILRLFRAGLILSRKLSEVSSLFRKGLAHYFLLSIVVFLIVLFGALSLMHFEGSKGQRQILTTCAAVGGAGVTPLTGEVWEQAGREPLEFEDAFWWAVFTVVASEPIDYSARTRGGRIVTFIIMFSGLTVFAFITGVISAFMVERLRMGLQSKDIHPEDLHGHFLVLGWNLRAPYIIEEIQAEPQHSNRVTVIMADRDPPDEAEWQRVDRSLVHFVRGDPINPKDLENLNIPESFSVVILADTCRTLNDVDRDARTVLCALMVEKLHPDVFTCAELLNRDHTSHLKLAGVEEVVIANESSAAVLAMAMLHLDMTKILDELLSFKHGNQFYKIDVPEKWVGKEFVDVVFEAKKEHNSLAIGLAPKRENWDVSVRGVADSKEIMINPPGHLRLAEGDKLLFIAEEDLSH